MNEYSITETSRKQALRNKKRSPLKGTHYVDIMCEECGKDKRLHHSYFCQKCTDRIIKFNRRTMKMQMIKRYDKRE